MVLREWENAARWAAALSMLPDEEGADADDFARIVAFADTLDTFDVNANLRHTPSRALLRPDEPREGLSAELALSNAPSVEGEYLRVPRALE